MSPVSAVIRVVIYLRISLDASGDGLAIDRQREACERICRDRGWEIVREYVDSSISAYKKNTKRPGYDQMTADYAAGLFDAIVVYDLDRLTRQPRQLEDWIDAAEDRGLRLVTANGEADLTKDAGRMFARIKAAVARQESERKSTRQEDAARQRAQRGLIPAGARAFGYRQDGKPLTEPTWCVLAGRREWSEAGITCEVFARFHGGDSLAGIARWLNEQQAPTRRGGLWSPHTVREMLVNPRYAGTVVYRRTRKSAETESFPGTFQALIEETIFEAVNDRLADPRRRVAFGTDRKHLGSGLYLCGVCGKRVRSHAQPTRYKCPDGHLARTALPIDDMVLRIARRIVAEEGLGGLSDGGASAEAEAAAAEVRRLRARLRQTQNDYDADLIDGLRYKEKSSKISVELARAEVLRSRLSSGSEVAAVLGAADPVRAFEAAPLGMQQAVIRFFFKVDLLPVEKGVKGFNPETVRITLAHNARFRRRETVLNFTERVAGLTAIEENRSV